MTEAEKQAERFAALAETKRTLKELSEEGAASAEAIGEAFQSAGDDISSALATAARTGELSFRDMAEAISQSLASLLVEPLISAPLTGLADRLGARLGALIPNIIGQRAEGGPVQAGGAYLVGERGPEVFTPGAGGAVSPLAAAPVTVIIHAGADTVESVRRSERQIAAAVARAAMAGRSSL